MPTAQATIMVQAFVDGSIPAAPDTATAVLVASAGVASALVPVPVAVAVAVAGDAVPVVVVVPPTPAPAPATVVVSWEAPVGLVAVTTMPSAAVDCEAPYDVDEKPQRLMMSLMSGGRLSIHAQGLLHST